MREFNIKNCKKIHFIGIGGISMLGLAKLMLHKKIKITGSDFQKSTETEKLKKQGVQIFYGHKKSNISFDLDLVVFTGAIKEDNIELVTARSLGIKTMERSEFLGEVSSWFSNVIAISGTHGKTTTTALIGLMFSNARLNPTVHIGGDVLDFDSNFVIGDNEYFITEACEYRESFKYLKPTTSVITNIEADHLDYYKTFDNLKIAFNKFAKSTKQNLILCNNRYIDINSLEIDVTSVGVNCLSHISACDIEQTDSGYKFDVREQDILVGEFEMNLFGYHNIYNALCAIAVGLKYGIDVENIKKSVRDFKGVKRRYEEIGKVNNIPIICDYAHHPTEIENSINGIKEKYKRVLCVFQPHTYTRTINLKNDFIKSLRNVDKIAIFRTYPAREKYQKQGSAKTLFKELKNNNKSYLISNFQIKKFLNKNTRSFDVILVLGAGDIYNRIKKVIFNKKIC